MLSFLRYKTIVSEHRTNFRVIKWARNNTEPFSVQTLCIEPLQLSLHRIRVFAATHELAAGPKPAGATARLSDVQLRFHWAAWGMLEEMGGAFLGRERQNKWRIGSGVSCKER